MVISCSWTRTLLAGLVSSIENTFLMHPSEQYAGGEHGGH